MERAFEMGCAACGEAIPNEECLSLWVEVDGDDDAGQQCWAHAKCVQKALPHVFRDRVTVNPRIAKMLGMEPYPSDEELERLNRLGLGEAIENYYAEHPENDPRR